jgi:endonuclease YncB( thermonuclease family)
MNQYLLSAIIAVAILAVIILSSQQDIAPFTVVSIHDGDTITVKDKANTGFEIRFFIVDSNENSKRLQQLGGEESTEYLKSILPISSKVSIDFTGRKSYERHIATVYFKGQNINLEMLKSGHAIIDERYIKQLPRESQIEYYQAQKVAKDRRLGRWSNKARQSNS